ncbi:RNA pyrophosphohydrolase [Dyadobacter sp. CECT 9623]|uniref:RNA pyrophosphohydrolase n=1 Tax=Dyadobacter linearis TaxID=2823330 RepID=A0ABM8UMS0_9BACT|nr:NUDIX hydrolase [Dyadobacter sp. CECT 9623]CAG5068705.1 RNA pyrophosphohydrolase [Dyadobacter sp. CECT 9623]
MTIFFDDRPFKIVRTNQLSAETSQFDLIVDLRLEKLHKSMLIGHTLFLNSNATTVLQMLQLLEKDFPKQMLSVTMAAKEKAEIEEKIKDQYKVIKAAGGVVVKDGKWLFMYRRKKWDLPKGKLDKGEDSRTAAVREIEEETGVKSLIKSKICTTWHTYTLNNNRILKRTKWYLCETIDDSKMQPQVEEQIEKLDWYKPSDAKALLINSYSSIRFVVDSLNKKRNVKS